MLFMVIERFRNADAEAVYRHFQEKGRMAPEGVTYVDSWISASMDVCFQIMETDDLSKLQEWVVNWSPVVMCEIVPVTPSATLREWMFPRLDAQKNETRHFRPNDRSF